MAYADQNELLITAKEYFMESQYKQAEPLLNQLVLRSSRSAEVFHMLGVIYYDQGKFNKAIRSFKKALDIEPTFTDASVGLSIILNDLGRYDEGQKVFLDAKVILDKKQQEDDPYANEKLALKHDELGELYIRYGRHKEALEQFFKANMLCKDKPQYAMNLVECLLKMDEIKKAVQQLKSILEQVPEYVPARLKLGQIYYDLNQVTSAIEQWEKVIEKQPDHPQALRLLRQTQAIETTGTHPTF